MMFISVVLPEPDGPKSQLQKAAAGVSNLRRSMHSIILILVNVIDQSACSDNLLHEGRKRLSFELPVLRLVGDDTGIEIDFALITRLNCFCRLRAFDDRQSDIDRITVKNPGKGLCNNTADASRLDSNRRVLSGRTAAEVFIRNNPPSGLFLQILCQYPPCSAVQALPDRRNLSNVRG